MTPNLLLLTDEFPPNIRGGIASWCRAVSIALASNGYKIMIFLPVKNRHCELNSFHPNVVFNFVKGHDWSKFRWLYMMITVTRWLLFNKNGIILGTTWQHVSGLVFLKKFWNSKVICFAHGTDITRAVTSNRIKSFRRTLSRIDLFVPVSNFLYEKVKSSCNFHVNTKILSNGIDCNHFRPIEAKEDFRKEFGLPEEKVIVLSMGRLVPVKGFDVLIRAVSIVKKTCPEIFVVIVGGKSGHEYERLSQLVLDLGLGDSIEFIKSVHYEKLPTLYNAVDIFALSSVPIFKPHYEEENLPMTLIEASACGLPVIGSQCGGIPEVIADNETGLLFESGDYQSLSNAIIKIMKSSMLISKFGTNGRKRAVELFDISRISNSLIELIEDLS